jgi:hypothetical protein
VELRGFEPLTPTLPVIRKEALLGPLSNLQENPVPFTAVECSWTLFRAHRLSTFSPPSNSVKRDVLAPYRAQPHQIACHASPPVSLLVYIVLPLSQSVTVISCLDSPHVELFCRDPIHASVA